MPKRLDMLESKTSQIKEMIRDLETRQKVLVSLGHAEHADAADDARVNFQKKRLAVLQWARDASEQEIQHRIHGIETSLGIAVFSKYSNVSGFPAAIVDKICEVELLELVLGTHPALGGTH